jgi:hypothetical protein
MALSSAAMHSLERRNLQNRKRGDHGDPGDQQPDELEERFDRRQFDALGLVFEAERRGRNAHDVASFGLSHLAVCAVIG